MICLHRPLKITWICIYLTSKTLNLKEYVSRLALPYESEWHLVASPLNSMMLHSLQINTNEQYLSHGRHWNIVAWILYLWHFKLIFQFLPLNFLFPLPLLLLVLYSLPIFPFPKFPSTCLLPLWNQWSIYTFFFLHFSFTVHILLISTLGILHNIFSV